MRYLGPSRDGRVPMAHAIEVFRRYRFCVLRLYLDAVHVWTGRIWTIKLTEIDQDAHGAITCQVDVEAFGFWMDLTLLLQILNPDYATEGISISAGDLIKMVVGGQQAWWLIEETFTELQDPGGNVGPLKLSQADYAHDLIVAALQKGSPDNNEYSYGIYEPVDGPFVRPREGEPPRWRLRLPGTGLGVVWDGRQYVSSAKAVFQDIEAHTSNTTQAVNSPVGEALHGGVQREVILSLGDTTLAAAQDTNGLHVLQHYDPVGLDGTLSIGRTIETIAGGVAPSCLVRASDVMELWDFLPDDPYFAAGGRLRRFTIEQATYQVDDSVLKITLDQRPLRSRRHERVSTWQNELRAIRPLLPGGTRAKLEYNQTIVVTIAQTATGDDIELTAAGKLRWEQFEVEEVQIAVQFQYAPAAASITEGNSEFGYALDGEDFSRTNANNSASMDYTSAQGTYYRTARASFKRVVGPGPHSINFWVHFPDQTGKSNINVRYFHAQVM